MKTHILEPMSRRVKLHFPVKKQLRKVVALFCLFIPCVLSGCAAEDFVLQYTGTMSDTDHQKYDELKNENLLDENGYYISSEMGEVSTFTPPKTASM